VALAAIVGCLLAPAGRAAKAHSFTGSYRGVGAGNVSGTSASGSATLTGRGKLIGSSSLSGSAVGEFTSSSCAVFSGTATLRGRSGSFHLVVRNAHACAGSANDVSFSGTAKVEGGTSAYAAAHGALSFKGTYTQSTRTVSITLRGIITY